MESRFSDTKTAFESRSQSELNWAYWFFKLTGNNALTNMGIALTNLSLKLRLPVKGMTCSTVFNQFCGDISEQDYLSVIQRMYNKGVGFVFDYSVGGKDDETSLEVTFQKTMETTDLGSQHRNDGIPIVVFKPTGLGRFAIFQKIAEGKSLTADEEKEWGKIKQCFDAACKEAHEYKLPILVDIEESWTQTAADNLVEEMMRKYNKEEVIVYNTLQIYRHDRLPCLKGLYERLVADGFYIGVKVACGAYMERGNERTVEQGYPTPICASKQTTGDNYNAVVTHIIEHIDRIVLFTGTHNEENAALIMDLTTKKGLTKDDKRVWIVQLYGTSDHISSNTSKEGYNAVKYLSFGPVRGVVPYSIRRTEENTSAAGQTGRELTLLSAEKKCRKTEKNS